MKPAIALGRTGSDGGVCGDELGIELKLPALVHAPELMVDVPVFWLLKLAATK